jgi:hypothetical protein
MVADESIIADVYFLNVNSVNISIEAVVER